MVRLAKSSNCRNVGCRSPRSHSVNRGIFLSRSSFGIRERAIAHRSNCGFTLTIGVGMSDFLQSRPGRGVIKEMAVLEIRNPKQIQNRKFECPKQIAKHAPLARHPRIPDKTVGRPRFEHLVFDIWICFGFRASDFEFQTCAHPARILRLKTLWGRDDLKLLQGRVFLDGRYGAD
jgi:hypothetical protein